MARVAHGTRSPAVIAATTLAGSVFFFLVTNFADWAGSDRYPQTAEGLANLLHDGHPVLPQLDARRSNVRDGSIHA